MRTGDNVVVPTRRSWIRCGISEPVTKTSRSETFSSFKVWPAGVPASEEVTDRRNRDAITNNIGVFTATKYTERVSCAISITLPNCTRSAAEDGGSYNHEFNVQPVHRGGWNPNSACRSPQSQCTNQSFSIDPFSAAASASALSTLSFKQ